MLHLLLLGPLLPFPLWPFDPHPPVLVACLCMLLPVAASIAHLLLADARIDLMAPISMLLLLLMLFGVFARTPLHVASIQLD